MVNFFISLNLHKVILTVFYTHSVFTGKEYCAPLKCGSKILKLILVRYLLVTYNIKFTVDVCLNY